MDATDKTKLCNLVSNMYWNCIILAQNVLIGTKYYLVWYVSLFVWQIWHFMLLPFFFVDFCCLAFMSKTASVKHVSDKVVRANYRRGRLVISCFRANLEFSIGYATRISIVTPPSLLCFLCLIDLFYRRYVSCMYDISNISTISHISNRLTID